MSDTKICSLCKKEQPLNKYRSRGGSQKHLLKSRCNKCLYKEHRRWVEQNPEKVLGYREKDSWTIEKDAEEEALRQKSFLSVTKSKKINALSAKKKYV